jgi:glucosamine-6-phosphate deaminase
MYPNIRLETETDYDAMSKKGAQIFAQAMKEHPQGAFGFATGSTPIGMYNELVRMHKEEKLDFSGVTTFNLDEYHPITRESKDSYYYFMQQHLFSHVNVDLARVFVPDGTATDVEAKCREYEDKMLEAGGIVMQILGIGANGHIGFNEPSESYGAETRLVPLADVTINSNARHFSSPDVVPRHALTMGIRSIMMAKHILFLANGASKASILRDALCGPITPLVPASALQLHPSVVVVADKEAAALL